MNNTATPPKKLHATVDNRTFGSHDVVELSLALLLAEEGARDSTSADARMRFRQIATAIRKSCA
jgi:hypothetical protein